MPRITAAELETRIGSVIDEAALEPVVVTKQGRDHVVLLSADRYTELLARSRRVRLSTSLTPEEIAAAEAACVPEPEEQQKILAAFAEHAASREPRS